MQQPSGTWPVYRALPALRWIANAALLTLCCVLVARTLTGIFAALLDPAPSLALVGSDVAGAAHERTPSWSDREIIAARNLFDAALVAPGPPPSPPEEEVEETELPLGLLGTIASASQPQQEGWAAIWDAESRERLVVEPGDEVRDGAATVLRIERKRLLLSEDGAVRELVFDEDSSYRPPVRPRRPTPSARARRLRRARR